MNSKTAWAGLCLAYQLSLASLVYPPQSVFCYDTTLAHCEIMGDPTLWEIPAYEQTVTIGLHTFTQVISKEANRIPGMPTVVIFSGNIGIRSKVNMESFGVNWTITEDGHAVCTLSADNCPLISSRVLSQGN